MKEATHIMAPLSRKNQSERKYCEVKLKGWFKFQIYVRLSPNSQTQNYFPSSHLLVHIDLYFSLVNFQHCHCTGWSKWKYFKRKPKSEHPLLFHLISLLRVWLPDLDMSLAIMTARWTAWYTGGALLFWARTQGMFPTTELGFRKIWLKMAKLS